MSINRAILLGHVGRDPEIKRLNSGDQVATFRLATTEYWNDKASGERKETTEWHTVVIFNQFVIQTVEKYVRKGSKVAVEGQIKTRKWTHTDGGDRFSTEIVISRFDGRLGLEGNPKGADRDERGYGTTKGFGQDDAGATRPAEGPASPSAGAGRRMDDDEIPF